MSAQTIVKDELQDVINDLDKFILNKTTDHLKNIRFEIGKGVTTPEQFKILFLRDIICGGKCSINNESYIKLIDMAKAKIILSKQEYL